MRLSASAEKRAAFAHDLYFRECWFDLQRASGARALGMLESIAILCAKPDAVVSRRLGPMLDYTREHGFVPVAVAPCQFTRHSMREIWRYDWHAYPADRLAFSSVLYSACDTLLFALQDIRRERTVPASVRLSDLKGDALAHRRKPGDLRSVLDPPGRFLNFVHIPDEPADIVRELGILFDIGQRRALLEEIMCHLGHDRRQHAYAAARQLEGRVEAHDLDVHKAFERIRTLPGARADAMARLAHALETGAKLGWDELCALQPPDAAGLRRWDFICLASALIAPEREVDGPLLPAADKAGWQRAARPARQPASDKALPGSRVNVTLSLVHKLESER
jgi:hypothetical protein